MTRRRAMTLIELLVVLSASMFILTLSAKLIHQAMRSHQDTRAFLDLERTAARLSHRFREDVRRATSAVSADDAPLPDGVLVQLRSSGSRIIEYGERDGTLRRTELEGDKILSRDDFALGPGVSCEVGRRESPALVDLTVTRAASNGSPDVAAFALDPPLRLRVEAGLAADFRHAPPSLPREEAE
ncbi:MAG: hypothetical protein FJ297_16210 [Planctomycetes bacterium]|nr:hypothetical protein [Planctomycetota bacterium]